MESVRKTSLWVSVFPSGYISLGNGRPGSVVAPVSRRQAVVAAGRTLAMRITRSVVADQRDWCLDRGATIVPLINDTRAALGEHFDADAEPVTEDGYREAIATTFADGNRAVNVATLVALLRDLDMADDYPGFVVDELLGRELAATIAGDQPLRLLAEATFHYADVRTHGEGDEPAGRDDLDAGLAAGVQTTLPGWPWRDEPSPYGVDADA
jgi:hypothetical protein